ncbi:MAG: hypothetical protein C3F06_00120 [Candidatus Methanoperedenaceae archaeon]|nr:MAG: hypothetical protein C3F06_00120 [Candidatus Methanoperedenaceae archaeon]
MYKFIYRVIEIKNILDHLWLIETVLDIAIIILAGFLLRPYIGISPYWMIIPILIKLIVSLRNKSKKNTVALIEEKYPELNERLRTIYDNKENRNVVLENLAESVLEDIDKIKYSSFFETKRLGIRIAIILLLVTFLVSSSIINPLYFDQKINQQKIDQERRLFPAGSSADIFDEPSFVSIANDSQGLLVSRGSGSELNVPGSDRKTPVVYPAFPENEDTGITSSQSYGETFPVIYQQIVKNYFMNITRE